MTVIVLAYGRPEVFELSLKINMSHTECNRWNLWNGRNTRTTQGMLRVCSDSRCRMSGMTGGGPRQTQQQKKNSCPVRPLPLP